MPDAYLPNVTQFPDILLDYWLAELSYPEWKALCYIVRHTYGFRKSTDAISLRQFAEGVRRADGTMADRGCGVRSRATLCAALRALEERGLIERYATPAQAGQNTPVTRYALTLQHGLAEAGKLRLVAGGDTVAEHPPGVSTANTGGTADEPHRGTRDEHRGYARRTPGSTADELTTDNVTTDNVTTDNQQTTGQQVGAVADVALVAPALPAATAPHPPSVKHTRTSDLERVSTEDDTGAPPARRLALDLARLLGWSNIGAATLRRFEGYMVVRLGLPFSAERYACAEERLLAFHDWLHSNGWWTGRGHMFSDAQMAKEWNDWVGQGEPRAKRTGRGCYR